MPDGTRCPIQTGLTSTGSNYSAGGVNDGNFEGIVNLPLAEEDAPETQHYWQEIATTSPGSRHLLGPTGREMWGARLGCFGRHPCQDRDPAEIGL